MLAAVIILGVTHLIGGIAAFGGALLAVPLLLLLTDLTPITIVFVLTCTGVTQALLLSLRTKGSIQYRQLCALLIPAVCALPLGYWLATALPAGPVIMALALLLIASGSLHLLHYKPVPSMPHRWHAVAGFAGGIVQGAWACGGSIIVTWVKWTHEDPSHFRATLSRLWLILNGSLLVGLLTTAPITSQQLPLIIAAIPVVVIATIIGDRLAHYLPRSVFHAGTCFLIICSGVLLLLRSREIV